MRWRAAAIVVASAMLFGCGPPGENYLANGVGSTLPARDAGRSTELLDIYFDHLCRQAGMASETNCQAPLMSQDYWTLIVRQGMNDIDRRCDAYLEWLDNLKRSRTPVLRQLGAVQTTTQSIIEVTHGSAAAMSIVGLAFQLLSQSIENYNSRLLLEVESSTINSVVLRAQHRFRAEMMRKAFTNRPDAEYVLRGYLRLCLPFAIETKINDFTTLGSQGILPDGELSINQLPEAGRVPAPPPRADEPIKPTKPIILAERIAGSKTPFEGNLKRKQFDTILGVLCLAPGKTFDDPEVRAGISVYEDLGSQGASLDERLDEIEGADLLAKRPCDNRKFMNFFERETLQEADTIKGVQEKLNEKLAAEKLTERAPNSGELDRETRSAIAALRQKLKLSRGSLVLDMQVTKELIDAIGAVED